MCLYSPSPSPSPSAPACAEPGALHCAGRCVAAELVCDGRDHCADGGGGGAGSDEDPFMCSSYSRATASDAALGVAATSRSACAAGEWQCANRACVPRAALCDGQDHCGDFSDERRCSEYSARGRRDLPLGVRGRRVAVREPSVRAARRALRRTGPLRGLQR
ncbi:low-density lipoprotein receptor-related protein 8-like [Cydia splendana]|uniref:low-density lipoprotein receptor-related protein 8-like n=1 Tax=Cydia splendana TaxID=1100963 RepID=UPI00300DAB59